MLAIVMSGAANYGAMQAGALEVLIGEGLQPDILVGTSAGALNSIYLAADPSLKGVEALQDNWRAALPGEVGVPNPLAAVRRLVTQSDGLVSTQSLNRFLDRRLPEGVDTFGELRRVSGVAAYAVAVEMESAELAVFGDNDDDRLIDGALASAAIPPYFPPWRVGDHRYLDGGIKSKLPLMAAIERGASQIVGLDVTRAMGSYETARGILGISGYAVSLMIEGQTMMEIERAASSGVGLRVITLQAPDEIPFWDYNQADRLIEMGREIARRDLELSPLSLEANWLVRLKAAIRSFRPS